MDSKLFLHQQLHTMRPFRRCRDLARPYAELLGCQPRVVDSKPKQDARPAKRRKVVLVPARAIPNGNYQIPEIVSMIAAYPMKVGDTHTLLQMSRVCQVWHVVATPLLWQNLEFSNERQCAGFAAALSPPMDLWSLPLASYPRSVLVNATSAAFMSALGKLTHLRDCDLRAFDVNVPASRGAITKALFSVTSLQITHDVIDSFYGMDAISRACKNVKHLRVFDVPMASALLVALNMISVERFSLLESDDNCSLLLLSSCRADFLKLTAPDLWYDLRSVNYDWSTCYNFFIDQIFSLGEISEQRRVLRSFETSLDVAALRGRPLEYFAPGCPDTLEVLTMSLRQGPADQLNTVFNRTFRVLTKLFICSEVADGLAPTFLSLVPNVETLAFPCNLEHLMETAEQISGVDQFGTVVGPGLQRLKALLLTCADDPTRLLPAIRIIQGCSSIQYLLGPWNCRSTSYTSKLGLGSTTEPSAIRKTRAIFGQVDRVANKLVATQQFFALRDARDEWLPLFVPFSVPVLEDTELHGKFTSLGEGLYSYSPCVQSNASINLFDVG